MRQGGILFDKQRVDKDIRMCPVNEQYLTCAPDAQNVLDLFDGEWSSRLPAEMGLVMRPGKSPLFEDGRIVWANRQLGGFDGQRVLELGPLEAGHSYMMQKFGAKEVIAVEANTRAYLKCLSVKEVLNLDRIRFLLGDFVTYAKDTDEKFDVVVASGVLYHMLEPLQLLSHLAGITNKLFLWTHYYDAAACEKNAAMAAHLGEPVTLEMDGGHFEACPYQYQAALEWSGFCGGPAHSSMWLTRRSILDCLENLGFDDIQINFDAPDHPNGPAFAICAAKSGARSGMHDQVGKAL